MSYPVVNLSELCEFRKGRKPSAFVEEGSNKARPYILIENFDGVLTRFTSDSNCISCDADDTLIVCDGARTGLCSIGHEGYVGSTIAALVPKQTRIIPKFLFDFIRGQFDLLNTRVRGAAIPHIDRNLLMTLTLALPPLSEQQRIVSILDEAEVLRKLRARADERTDRLVPATFNEMFGDVSGDTYPIHPLFEVAEVVSGIAKGRKFNGQRTVNVPYLRVANVQDGYLDLSEIKYIEALSSEVEALTLESVLKMVWYTYRHGKTTA
ncbi:MAG: restriction endonuclease subunit S [Anaerolineae bacterium]